MENQHCHIEGSRALAQAEIDAMNKITALGNEVGRMVESLQGFVGCDQRWISVAKTQLQQGFMALMRGVEQPDRF